MIPASHSRHKARPSLMTHVMAYPNDGVRRTGKSRSLATRLTRGEIRPELLAAPVGPGGWPWSVVTDDERRKVDLVGWRKQGRRQMPTPRAVMREAPVSILLTHVSTNREGPKVTDGRYVSLCITDEVSRMTVVKVVMSAAEFTQMMSGATTVVREGAEINISGALGVPPF